FAITSWRRRLRVLEAQAAGATSEEAEDMVPKVKMHLVEVSFDRVSDPQQRNYLKNLPTSFVLPPEDVDELRAAAGELLRQSPGYQHLLEELGGTMK
ncbi:MAG: hypothetical protein V7709_10950, partial [Halioglobus sp.]